MPKGLYDNINDPHLASIARAVLLPTGAETTIRTHQILLFTPEMLINTLAAESRSPRISANYALMLLLALSRKSVGMLKPVGYLDSGTRTVKLKTEIVNQLLDGRECINPTTGEWFTDSDDVYIGFEVDPTFLEVIESEPKTLASIDRRLARLEGLTDAGSFSPNPGALSPDRGA